MIAQEFPHGRLQRNEWQLLRIAPAKSLAGIAKLP